MKDEAPPPATNVVSLASGRPVTVFDYPASPELRAAIREVIDPYPVSLGAPSARVVAQAKDMISALGPLRMIGLAKFTDWIEPMFMAAGSRAAQSSDRNKQIYALWDLVSDMPDEVFTADGRRRVAAGSEFVPTAKRIRDAFGEDAAKVIAWHRALAKLADQAPAPPPSPDPAPLTDEERAARAALGDEIVARYRSEVAPAASPVLKDAGKPLHASPEALAAMRAANPLVQRALEQAAAEREMKSREQAHLPSGNFDF